MIDVPETQHQRSERGRLATRGRSTDDGTWTTLLVVHESNGAWTFHGLGAPGVTLSKADMVALAESILERAPVSGNGRAFLTVDGPDGWAIRITDADPVPADPEAVAVSASLPDGAVHLVAADDSLAEGHRYGVYIGMCGELLAALSLPPSLCPDDCDRDHPYCPDCLREAARKHA